MLLDPAVVEPALQGVRRRPAAADLHLPGQHDRRAGDKQIPYSTITAIDFAAEPPLGPFDTPDGKADRTVGRRRDRAQHLGRRRPGRRSRATTVEITYFEPESTHGEVRESKATFRLKAIVAIERPGGRSGSDAADCRA